MQGATRKIRHKVLIGLLDLFLYCDQRLSYNETLLLSQKSVPKADKRRIAYNQHYYYEAFYKLLIDRYRDRGLITFGQYAVSKTIRVVFCVKRFITFILSSKKYSLIQTQPKTYRSKYLSYIDIHPRLKAHVADNLIENIDIESVDIRPNLKERVSVLIECWRDKVNDPEIVLQCRTIQAGLSHIKLDGHVLIVEESQDLRQQAVVEYAKNNGIPVLITSRGLNYNSRYLFDCHVITDNVLNANLFKILNAKVSQIRKPYLLNLKKAQISKERSGKIGYCPDLGNLLINYHDKLMIDQFMKRVSEKLKIRLSISVHPQQKITHKEYYQKMFSGALCEFRNGTSIEEYLNSIDILVGWYSTTLYQSLLMKKPVIIVDLFGDRPMKNLAEVSCGLMSYACDELEFKTLYKYYMSLSSESVCEMHHGFLTALNIDFSGDGLEDLLIKNE